MYKDDDFNGTSIEDALIMLRSDFYKIRDLAETYRSSLIEARTMIINICSSYDFDDNIKRSLYKVVSEMRA